MSIDEQIKEIVKSEVKIQVTESLEPVMILKGFEDVEMLTFDEVCKIFRYTDEKLINAIDNGSIPVIKSGKLRSDWRFPKYQIAVMLAGEKPKKKKSEFDLMAMELI